MRSCCRPSVSWLWKMFFQRRDTWRGVPDSLLTFCVTTFMDIKSKNWILNCGWRVEVSLSWSWPCYRCLFFTHILPNVSLTYLVSFWVWCDCPSRGWMTGSTSTQSTFYWPCELTTFPHQSSLHEFKVHTGYFTESLWTTQWGQIRDILTCVLIFYLTDKWVFGTAECELFIVAFLRVQSCRWVRFDSLNGLIQSGLFHDGELHPVTVQEHWSDAERAPLALRRFTHPNGERMIRCDFSLFLNKKL